MNTRLPPINTLLAFEAVARHGSFSKAAEELCLTHGAVSHRIKLLEDHLLVMLLDRSARQVSLTPEGRLYLSRVTEAMHILRSAAHEVGGTPPQRWLKVNVLPGFAGSWLISRLGNFRKRHPDVDIAIDAESYSMSEFDAQQLDVAVRYCSGDFPGFRNLKLVDVRLTPVCSPSYRRRTNLMEPADLTNEDLLAHQVDPWDIWFGQQGLQDVKVVPTGLYGDPRLLVDAALQGDGIALVRDVIAKREIEQGTLVRVFNFEAISPKSYYVLAKQKPRQFAETDVFLEWVLEQAKHHA